MTNIIKRIFKKFRRLFCKKVCYGNGEDWGQGWLLEWIVFQDLEGPQVYALIESDNGDFVTIVTIHSKYIML